MFRRHQMTQQMRMMIGKIKRSPLLAQLQARRTPLTRRKCKWSLLLIVHALFRVIPKSSTWGQSDMQICHIHAALTAEKLAVNVGA